MVTLSKRTTDDELARAIFNIDTDFTNQRDLKLATAIASKWLKGDVEISPIDPRFKIKQQPAEQFENWTKEVMKEGTWHLPSDESEVKAFAQIMSKPIPVGDTDEPGTGGATDVIGKFFGDDELYDEMYVVHQKNGEEADARPAIYAWLKKAAEAGYEEPHDSILKKMVQAVNPNFDQNYKMEEDSVEEGRLGFSDIEKFGKEIASKIDMEARRRGSADMEPGDADELRYKIAKEMGLVEKEETIDEPQFEDESIAEIDHMRKLAGVMSQTPKAKKKENIHKTTPRSIHKRQK